MTLGGSGWLPSLGVLTRGELRAGNEQIDAAAEKAGRDPRSIRRIINVQGLIGEQPAPSRSELRVGYLAGEPLAGSADWWVETCAGFVDGRLRHACVLAGGHRARLGRLARRRRGSALPPVRLIGLILRAQPR